MELSQMVQIMQELGPQALGNLVSKINAETVSPNEYLFEGRPVGYRGIPVSVPKMQAGLYGRATNPVRA